MLTCMHLPAEWLPCTWLWEVNRCVHLAGLGCSGRQGRDSLSSYYTLCAGRSWHKFFTLRVKVRIKPCIFMSKVNKKVT